MWLLQFPQFTLIVSGDRAASAVSADNKAAIAPSYEPVQYAIIPHWLVKVDERE